MNQPHDDPNHSDHAEFLKRLASTTPAPCQRDPLTVFYEAGFAAASTQHKYQQRKQWRLSLAAAACAICVVGPLCYQAGRNSLHSNIAKQHAPSQPAETIQAPSSQRPNHERQDAPAAQPGSPNPSPQLVQNTSEVPQGILTNWLTRSLTNQAQRPLSLVGAKGAPNSIDATNTTLPHPAPTIDTSSDDQAEPVLRRGDWQIMLPTL